MDWLDGPLLSLLLLQWQSQELSDMSFSSSLSRESDPTEKVKLLKRVCLSTRVRPKVKAKTQIQTKIRKKRKRGMKKTKSRNRNRATSLPK